MSEVKNVPEIRFKGFNEPWNTEKIQDLIDRQAITSHLDGNHGELYPRANEFSNSGIPYISANDFVTGYISFTGCKYLPTQRALQFKKGIAKDGDVLFAHNATVGPVAKLTTSYEFVILSTTATYFRCDNKTLINDYFLQALSNKKFVEQYSRVMAQSTRNQVPITVQRKFSISIPENTSEQTTIGNTFQKLDSLINQHQQKHDKLSNIKKAMLEKMFPKQGETIPEIRFKGFSGEWKASQLSELALLNPKEELPVTFKYVDLESVKGTSLLGYREELKESAPSRAQRLAKKGDVFFQTVRPYQKNNYLFNMEEIDFVFSTGYAQLRPYYDGNFLLNLIQRDPFVKDVLDNCTGTSYPAINASVLASLEVIYPETKEEQTTIGNYFQKLDALINQHQQQITKLNNIKQACLSKMFV